MGCFTISMHLKLLGFWTPAVLTNSYDTWKTINHYHRKMGKLSHLSPLPSIYFRSPPQKNTWQEICSRIFSSSVFNLPWQIQKFKSTTSPSERGGAWGLMESFAAQLPNIASQK